MKVSAGSDWSYQAADHRPREWCVERLLLAALRSRDPQGPSPEIDVGKAGTAQGVGPRACEQREQVELAPDGVLKGFELGEPHV
jgi:hypothetical protein